MIQHFKSRLFKVTIIGALLLVAMYWRQVTWEPRLVQPLFVINSSVCRTESTHSSKAVNSTAFSLSDTFNETSSHNSTSSEPGANPTEVGLCGPLPPNLSGPFEISKDVIDMKQLEKYFPELEPGGMFITRECRARYVVALVIPYRDRSQHLSIFLNNIHRMLMKQQIDYGIFVVEQEGNRPFNRGKLFNVGFVEAMKIKKFDCFIFHDVDLIPEDDRNLYTCPEQPRHLSVAIDKFKYRLPYASIFGGVSAMSVAHFKLVNGFSNMFWGWGGEDDDMFKRIRRKNLHVSRYPPTIARYKMLFHMKQNPNPRRFEVLLKGEKMYATDGLNNLKYVRKAIELRRLYTWVLVDLQPPS